MSEIGVVAPQQPIDQLNLPQSTQPGPTAAAAKARIVDDHIFHSGKPNPIVGAGSLHAAAEAHADSEMPSAQQTASVLVLPAAGSGSSIAAGIVKGAARLGPAIAAAGPAAAGALAVGGLVAAVQSPAGEDDATERAHVAAFNAKYHIGPSISVFPNQPPAASAIGSTTPNTSSDTRPSTSTFPATAPRGSTTSVTPQNPPGPVKITTTPNQGTRSASELADTKVDANTLQQKYFPTWTVRDTAITKASPATIDAERSAFDGKNGIRTNYLRDLGTNHSAELAAHGFSSTQIAELQAGKCPDGYNVHHIQSLAQGGTNDYSNLILMQDQPYHRAITGLQNSSMYALQSGQSRVVPILTPPANVHVWP